MRIQSTVPDPDLMIGGGGVGGGHPEPEIMGGGAISKKFVFGFSGLSLV